MCGQELQGNEGERMSNCIDCGEPVEGNVRLCKACYQERKEEIQRYRSEGKRVERKEE